LSSSDKKTQRRLIFIAGWGRSGSTILASVLGSIDRAASLGEVRYLWDRGLIENRLCGCGTAVRDCGFWSRVVDRAGIVADGPAAAHMATRIGKAAVWRQLGALLTGRIGAYRAAREGELRTLRRVYRAAFDEAGVDTLIDASKTPPYAINLLEEAGFTVYILHLVRDPRAVAFSWARWKDTEESQGTAWFPRYSALRSALYWVLFNWLALRFESIPGSRYLRVRYKDFCAEPRRVTADILRFCDIPAENAHWTGANRVALQPQHSISGNPTRFRTGTVSIERDDEWLTAMPWLSRLVVTAVCAPLMRRFGYALLQAEDRPVPAASRLERLKDSARR